MRDAIAEDLRSAGETVILFSAEDYSRDERMAFQRKAATANLTLVIAPEFGGILEERCRWVKEAGGLLLGPAPEAVRLTSDKLTLARYLETSGVRTPRTWIDPLQTRDRPFPQVWKPRDGAGSIATIRVEQPEDVARQQGVMATFGWEGELIGQEWVEGRPASVAFLVGRSGGVPLLPAWQTLSEDGLMSYQGGELPIPEPFATRAISLAARAIRSVPNLLGYVGVDLILGTSAEGDRVIEINPRLTTSYVGLRALAQDNLAAMMVAFAEGGPEPEPQWREGTVRFSPDGRTLVRK